MRNKYGIEGLPLGPPIFQIIAREGSQRVQDKNIADIAGKPLLAYSILVALAVGQGRVIINTDSPRYAEIAAHYGAEAPFLRPKELAGAKSSIGDASYYAINYFREQERIWPQALITLYPTSPFRNVTKLRRMIADLDRFKWVISAAAVDLDWSRLALEQEHEPTLLQTRFTTSPPDNPLAKPLGTFQGWSFMHLDLETIKYYLIDNPIELIDIDYPEDIELMRQVIAAGLYDFGVSF
jgi:hypothetical protein